MDRLTRDDLEMASEACMLEDSDPMVWIEKENLPELEEFLSFCKEEAEKMLMQVPQSIPTFLTDPRAGLITGMLMGIRYANLVHHVRNNS